MLFHLQVDLPCDRNVKCQRAKTECLSLEFMWQTLQQSGLSVANLTMVRIVCGKPYHGPGCLWQTVLWSGSCVANLTMVRVVCGKPYHGPGCLWRLQTCVGIPDRRWQHRQVIHELIQTVDYILAAGCPVRHLSEHLVDRSVSTVLAYRCSPFYNITISDIIHVYLELPVILL